MSTSYRLLDLAIQIDDANAVFVFSCFRVFFAFCPSFPLFLLYLLCQHLGGIKNTKLYFSKEEGGCQKKHGTVDALLSELQLADGAHLEEPPLPCSVLIPSLHLLLVLCKDKNLLITFTDDIMYQDQQFPPWMIPRVRRVCPVVLMADQPPSAACEHLVLVFVAAILSTASGTWLMWARHLSDEWLEDRRIGK